MNNRGVFRRLASPLLTAFLLGAICGAAAMMPVLGPRVDGLRLDKEQLHTRCEELQFRITNLEAQLDRVNSDLERRSALVVKEVGVLLSMPESPTKVALEKKLKEQVDPLVGRKVRDLDAWSVYTLLHGYITRLNGSTYTFTVNSVVVSERITFFVGTQVEEGEGDITD